MGVFYIIEQKLSDGSTVYDLSDGCNCHSAPTKATADALAGSLNMVMDYILDAGSDRQAKSFLAALGDLIANHEAQWKRQA